MWVAAIKEIFTDKLEAKVWVEKVIDFFMSRTIVYVINVLIGLLGLGKLLHTLGYIFLYGYFFGKSTPSLLSLLVSYVPFNVSACLTVGLFLLSIIFFLCFSTFLVLKKKLKWYTLVIIWSIYFCVLNIIVIFWGYSVNVEYLGFFLKGFWEYAEVNFFFVIQVFLVFLISYILYFFRFDQKGKKYSLMEFMGYSLSMLAIILSLALPVTSIVIFNVGKSIGNSLEEYGHITNKHNYINGQHYFGKIVAADDNYIYISDSNRKLITIYKNGKLKETDADWYVEDLLNRI